MGYRAAAAARPGPVEEGNVGAGTGATVGKLGGVGRATKGGLGCAVGDLEGVHLGAIMAGDAARDGREPQTPRPTADAPDAPHRPPPTGPPGPRTPRARARPSPTLNHTLGPA